MDYQQFALDWTSSWNSHDMEHILTHYSDDIEVTTPMIRVATGGTSDSLKGKEAVREYWSKGLEKFPDLHFELKEVTVGVNSVALYYKSIMNKMSIEVMFFNEAGKVNRMFAHYS